MGGQQVEPSSLFDAVEDSTPQVLWEVGDCLFCRRWYVEADGSRRAVLAVLPAAGQPTAATLDRLAHEYGLKDALDGSWAARPLELVRDRGRTMLVLEEQGGEPLDRLVGAPMEVERFLHLAIGITVALGKVHQAGLIHKDVNPAYILVNRAGEVRLTGFGIASRLPRERQAPEPPEFIAGTLAYMAPEQTGRMNRSIDARSDLYALGVTFYEMLTGTLPFTAVDPMEWVHCHLARQPVPPAERVADIPGPVSAIVMKLLAKTAENRYQTAAGLMIDLQRCLAECQATGSIAPFQLGRQDVSDRLLIPERLYGREREIDCLLAAFDRVVTHGRPELVVVSGYSGIGKSSVVNELHKALVPPRGLFASGKFDQYKRDIPYATLAQAFGKLVRPLLGQSEAELGQWRDALREALGPNGQLILTLVPELVLVIGKQPPIADLPPQEAHNRFQMVFRRFLGVFARKEHPLVLFLDDMQWLDTATLDLFEHLVTHSEVQHLMLVGAYRDNEVGLAHPLLRTLAAIRSAGTRVQQIVLAPLCLDDVERLIADALHCEQEPARPLAQLVQEKTGGNPFFAIQFLTGLAEEGLIAVDLAVPAWQWDIDRIRAKSHTDNVVDLMAGKLNRLPDGTQEALLQLACLGNAAEIATLTMVLGETEQAIHAALWEAVRAGFIIRLESSYTFLHDRIQQAAYTLIPEEHRAGVHLRLGRALLGGMTADQLTEHLFDLANQLNRGSVRLSDRDEKAQVAMIDLRAGRKAKGSAAYASACAYFLAGMALLGEEDWASRYELTFSLTLECAECEFLTGELHKTELLIAELLQRGTSKVDLAAVYHLKVLLHIVKSEDQQAVDDTLTCLKLFGIDIPAHPTREQLQAEYETVWRNVKGRSIEDLIELPLMKDPELEAAMRLLSALSDPAYVTDRNLFCLQQCRMVNLSMQHGATGAFAHACAYLGFILGPAFHRYAEGFRFAKLGCDLIERHDFPGYRAKVQDATGIAAFWTGPMATAIEYIQASVRAAIETGDLTYGCYGISHIVSLFLIRNDTLDAVWRESEIALDFVRKVKFRDLADIIVSQQRFIATMQGRTANFSTFTDAQFDEASFEALLTEDRQPTMICWYWIAKGKARFLSGHYAAALAAADKAKTLLWSSTAHFPLLDYYYYTALTIAALCEGTSAGDRPRWGELLELRDQLREWADNYPPTFADKHALVAAEIARLEGRDLDAMNLYQQAIRLAHDHGFVQNEGLAHEVAARFYMARGYETFANAYLRNARYCYLRWGGEGKARQLEQLHPHLGAEERDRSWATIGTPVQHLDVASVVKSSQAVSSEIVLPRLIERLMTIALQHAGADRGLLILSAENDYSVQAEARSIGDQTEVVLYGKSIVGTTCPESLLRYVIRTRESIIVDDASKPHLFSDDGYLRSRQTRSILCLPLIKQGQLIGLLYFENTLTSHAFTAERIAILELLAAQAAISVENARLYAQLHMSEDRWRNLFESVPVGVVLTGSHGRYVAANHAFQRMTGYSEAELRNLSPVDITHEDDGSAAEVIIAARDAHDPYPQHVEKRYRRKDGGVISVDASAFVIPVVGGDPLFAGVVVDITDRKHAEEELRRSEASLAEAQQISHTGSWRWTVGTGEVFWSAEHFRIFALNPATAQPSYATFIDRVHPKDQPAFEQVLERAVRERSRFQHEYRIVLPDGSVKHVQSVGQLDTEARDLEFVGTVIDVTERRRAEEALRNAQAELVRVARLTTMGELVASIAHEINQPLSAVVTNGGAALRWLNRDGPNIREACEAVERIVEEGTRAADVIRGLRALTRKSGPQLAKLDINDAIQEVLALTRSELNRHGVVLSTDLSAEGPVFGDRVQLQQVLLNLTMNAIEAMSSVTDRPKKLAITSQVVDQGDLLVAVEDTGPGLDPAIAQRIFDPFFTTKPDGMGMGLSICRSIIESHGGRFWASPGAPCGTVFQFSVPGVTST
jgi:PAS domain S-box-containing protein